MTLNHQIYKSNALIEASYRLTPAEQGIILSCVSQIHKGIVVTDQTTYSVSINDFVTLTGADPKSAYRLVKEAAIRLWDRGVTLFKKPNGQGRINNKERKILARWIQSVEYHDDEGKVSLRFSHEILPYITNLTECFTKYNLDNVAKMSSSYGIRLYEILIQWGSIGKREVSIEWLKNTFEINEKYKTIKDLKKRVLEPALKDINQFSNIQVKFTQRKTGRKITHFIFNFKEIEKNKSKPKKLETQIQGVSKSLIEKQARPGESYEQAARRIRNKMGNKL